MKSLLFVMFVFYSTSSIACKCGELEIEERLLNSKKVFLGTLINAQVLGDGSRVGATLQVVESFKGDVFIHEEVITNNSSCGVRFTISDSYLVFENDLGEVNQCTMYNTSFRYSKYMQESLDKLRELNKE
jgi:hypothetical protein